MAKAKTKSASGKRSKQKGSAAELRVAKFLEHWWSTEANQVRFRRTPGSGGWSRAAENMDGFGSAGDIVTTDKTFPFCVEVKHYAQVPMDALLHSDKPLILEWWKQAEDQCPSHLHPLLIYRRNGVSETAVISVSDFPDHNVSVAELVKDMTYLKFRRPNQDTLVLLRLCDLMLFNPELIAFPEGAS